MGWRACFGALVLLGMILGIASLIQLRETRPSQNEASEKMGQLAARMLRDPFVITCSLLISLCNGVLFSFYSEAPYLLIDQLQLSQSQYAWIGVFICAPSLISGILSRRLIHSWSAEELIRMGALWMGGGALCFCIICAMAHLAEGSGLVWAFLVMFPLLYVFFGMGFIFPNGLSIALKNYRNCAGTAGSLFGFSYYVLIALLTAGIGALHNGTIFPLPFYILAMSLAAIGASYRLCSNQSEVLA